MNCPHSRLGLLILACLTTTHKCLGLGQPRYVETTASAGSFALVQDGRSPSVDAGSAM